MDAADQIVKPALTEKNVKFVLDEQFGFPPKSIKSIKKLESYDDQNFCVKVRAYAVELPRCFQKTSIESASKKSSVRRLHLIFFS